MSSPSTSPGTSGKKHYTEELFLDTASGFTEYMPVDDFLDTYLTELDSLSDETSAVLAPGQNKGAKKPPATAAGRPAKLKKKRSLNARQQMLNKLAQLRYRERKKAKLADLENTVDELSEQIKQKQFVQGQNAALEQQNAYLQSVLLQKDAEIAQVQRNGTAHAALSLGSKPKRSAAEEKAELNALVQKWLATVEELRQLLALVGLDKNGPLAGGILKSLSKFSMLAPEQQRVVHNVIVRVEMLVETVVGLCVRVLRLSGASIEAIMNANYERCATLAGWKEERKWVNIAIELNFTPEQRVLIMQERVRMLEKLRRVYEERRQLNIEALQALMLPPVSGGPDGELSESDKEHLTQVIQRLEENLSAEQQAVSEQEVVCFKHLLTPLQAGLFVVKAFPDHCDCLALLNAVYQVYGG